VGLDVFDTSSIGDPSDNVKKKKKKKIVTSGANSGNAYVHTHCWKYARKKGEELSWAGQTAPFTLSIMSQRGDAEKRNEIFTSKKNLFSHALVKPMIKNRFGVPVLGDGV